MVLPACVCIARVAPPCTGIAHLESLRSLVLEVAAPFQVLGTGSSGHSSGWGPGAVLGAAGLVGEVAGDLSAVAGNMGVPLLGTNAITAFGRPPQFSIGMLSVGAPVRVAAAPAYGGSAGVCVCVGSVGDHKLVGCVLYDGVWGCYSSLVPVLNLL